MKTKIKPKILIADDAALNRSVLAAMLGDDYDILEAENGAQALSLLQQHHGEMALLMLDLVMPDMDGFEVLKHMNRQQWIENVPVIMISAESNPENMEHAYELGVTDFISRPFDALIVQRRVKNTILLYAKQKKLQDLVKEQIYQKEKLSNLMIDILSHIVEFRNGESGLHVVHIHALTEMILRQLTEKTNRYPLSQQDIALIGTASSLHDIGKIAIPEEILNKPGRLTEDEFAVIRTHTMVGATILKDLPIYQNEPFIEVAYEICRWHHERYDGGGYPDGLKGDEIPISAQVVSLADVYDALTSRRVYKGPYSHEKAVQMILNGECGAFNPLLLECLTDISDNISAEMNRPVWPDQLKTDSFGVDFIHMSES